MTQTTIQLIQPIKTRDGEAKEIVLREPRYGDLIELGEPSAYAQSAGGMFYTSEKDDVIKSYIERLLVSPKDFGLLNQLCLADTIALKGAIHDFFASAREQLSKRGPSSSSST